MKLRQKDERDRTSLYHLQQIFVQRNSKRGVFTVPFGGRIREFGRHRPSDDSVPPRRSGDAYAPLPAVYDQVPLVLSLSPTGPRIKLVQNS